MKFIAIVMAGGKGERLKINVEKPLLPLGDKPIIRRVIDVLKEVPSICKIVVAVSPHTPNTKLSLSSLKDISILETDGLSYHEDLKKAVKLLGAGPFLIVSADLPFLSSKIINFIIEKYLDYKKPALTVMAPLSEFLKYDLTPTSIIKVSDKDLVPCGINIIDGEKIDEPYIDEAILIMNEFEVCFNINTISDYLKSLKYLNKLF
ncbi:MAG: NTP transferase domain-containing protein [Candidatus Methanomethyliaceae archaeon]|nr:NTP transferase domain-containing protein [Candidatus Methanomethyliaceae archaeon]MDW7970299.1 NTP transferase domain-containing protein [Nitrososphaerota archaeon]